MLTDIFKTLVRLNKLLRARRWTRAYAAADELEMVAARESGDEVTYVHTPCTVTDINEYRARKQRVH